jgi:hypothetical protein
MDSASRALVIRELAAAAPRISKPIALMTATEGVRRRCAKTMLSNGLDVVPASPPVASRSVRDLHIVESYA